MMTMTQTQLANYLPIALKANVVPFVTGMPGVGKSAIVKKVADSLNMELIDLRLSQLMVYDLAGLISPSADKTKASYLPIDTFPLETDPLPEGKKGYLLFLDEFNSADRTTLAGAYKLILDRQIGDHKLHPNVRIVCAGNRINDNAIVNRIGTAMQTRLVHINMEHSIRDFVSFAEDEKWDPILTSYFHFNPSMVNTYDPNQTDEVNTFATPRSWEFLQKQLPYLMAQSDKDLMLAAICGTIGDKAGSDFSAYLRLFGKLPSLQEIEQSPKSCRLPDDDDIGSKWAICGYLADKYTSTNADALITYTLRLDEPDLIVMAFRTAIKRYPMLSANPQVVHFLTRLSKQID